MASLADERYEVSVPKLTVLILRDEDTRFDAYCRDCGYEKSPLVPRLIRERLEREGLVAERRVLESAVDANQRWRTRRG